MSSCLWGKNTFLPCTWLCSMASAGCVLFAFLCLVPRAPTFPICTHDGGRESLANRRNKRGWGIRKGTNPITLHLTAFELRPAGWTLNETCFPFAFRISLVLLKQKRQELNVTITQMSAGKESILQAVGDVLSNNGIQEEKRGVMVLLPPASSWLLPETALCSGYPPHTWLSGLNLSCVLELLCSPHCELQPVLAAWYSWDQGALYSAVNSPWAGPQPGTCWVWLGRCPFQETCRSGLAGRAILQACCSWTTRGPGMILLPVQAVLEWAEGWQQGEQAGPKDGRCCVSGVQWLIRAYFREDLARFLDGHGVFPSLSARTPWSH